MSSAPSLSAFSSLSKLLKTENAFWSGHSMSSKRTSDGGEPPSSSTLPPQERVGDAVFSSDRLAVFSSDPRPLQLRAGDCSPLEWLDLCAAAGDAVAAVRLLGLAPRGLVLGPSGACMRFSGLGVAGVSPPSSPSSLPVLLVKRAKRRLSRRGCNWLHASQALGSSKLCTPS